MWAKSLTPRAWTGYLVGYQSSNIYRVWIPSIGRTISTCDVAFDEDTVFSGKQEDIMDNLMHSMLTEIAAWIQTVELPEQQLSEEAETTRFYEDDTVQEASAQEDHQLGYNQGRKINYTYPTPPSTPLSTPPPVALLTQLLYGVQLRDSHTSSSQTIPWEATFMASIQGRLVGTHHGKIVDKAQMNRRLWQGLKLHLSKLPPSPTSHTRLETHPLRSWFKEAEKKHLESHREMESWSEIPAKTARLTGQQILNCMWVYTYKLDRDHCLIKCKARLVVQGDQQRNITSQDTYAATLASRSFRTLMVITAEHNLKLKQYDVTNAFVHATMDRVIYMRMPHGFQKPGMILQVNKALYGLRISPLPWQKEFTSTLKAEGVHLYTQDPRLSKRPPRALRYDPRLHHHILLR
jgi:hypothetical protein